MQPTVLDLTFEAVYSWYKQHHSRSISTSDIKPTHQTTSEQRPCPLFVALSGPQGSGKTTLVKELVKELDQRVGLKAVALSADDLYLTHAEQVILANTHKSNTLLQYRGLPGTHGISLGVQVLSHLARQNEHINNSVSIPCYDKSLYQGRGDRMDELHWKTVTGPVDIVLFEGWFLGFRFNWNASTQPNWNDILSSRSGFTSICTQDNLIQVLNSLVEYNQQWYPFIHAFIHIITPQLDWIYDWRWEQEQTMKHTANTCNLNTMDTVGLSRVQVNDFVDRFIPVYRMCLPRLISNGFFEETERQHSNQHLQIWIDYSRKLVSYKYI
ncbi:hypothetical protein O5D80_003303 [Batrachochytrium dendrobatidis]|nr:hypothetical protein O5D80_003303 [Batrachochytrium dendrobatidis]